MKFIVSFQANGSPFPPDIEEVLADGFDLQDGLIRFYDMVPWPPDTKVIPYEGSTHYREYHTFLPQGAVRKIMKVAN